ncbi:hypothetical protein [Lactococcus lactis]|uniref:hypothetical protein n=1 Tax=Lactococcus lactis TaxID=1358 RepID=UPI0035674658
MKKLALTFGSFSLIWLYLLSVAGTQIYINNQRQEFLIALVSIIALMIVSFIIVWQFVNFKIDSSRNRGLKQFSEIYQDRKISLDFIAANIFPLMSMELFEKVSFATFSSRLVMIGILFAVVNYTQSFAFNPYLYILKYRVYKTKNNTEALLLIKKREFGNKTEFQQELRFEEIENSKIYIKKQEK